MHSPLVTLLQDLRLRTVGNGAVDLHTAVDRTWMQHNGIRLGQSETLFVQAVEMGVFFLRWEEPGFLTFELDAQHHHDVGILDGFVKIHLQLLRPFS